MTSDPCWPDIANARPPAAEATPAPIPMMAKAKPTERAGEELDPTVVIELLDVVVVSGVMILVVLVVED